MQPEKNKKKRGKFIVFFVISVLLLSCFLAKGEFESSGSPDQKEAAANENIAPPQPVAESPSQDNQNAGETPAVQEAVQKNAGQENIQNENLQETTHEQNIPIETENQASSETVLISIDEITGSSANSEVQSGQAAQEENSAAPGTKEIQTNESGNSKCILFKENIKELETVGKCEQITKTEEVSESGDIWVKKTRIASKEHFENPVKVYNNIPETEKSGIRLYWIAESGKADITEDAEFEVAFYDSNSNGLIDRISWIVPHLSEQNFEIIINFTSVNSSENDSSNSTIEMQTLSPLDGKKTNPVEFKFNISYQALENVSCNLAINNISIDFMLNNSFFDYARDLQNGNYTWNLYCKDINNPQINKSLSGNFYIDFLFSLDFPNYVYLLGETVPLVINSENSNVSLKIKNPDNSVSSYEIKGSYPYSLILNTSILNKEGVYILNATSYHLAKPYSIIKNLSVARIEMDTDKKSIIENQSVRFFINISSPERILWYWLDFNDSYSSFNQSSSQNINTYIDHIYTKNGSYKPKLTVAVIDRTLSLEKNGISVSKNASVDTESPDIDLIHPDDNEVINDKTVTFSYSASDNVKLANCTFQLYNNSGLFGVLVYSETKTGLQNNQQVDISLTSFENISYSWYVSCYDNSSNKNEVSRDFTVDLDAQDSPKNITPLTYSNDNFAEQQDVDALISRINNFYTKESSFSAEEKEAAADLGIDESLDFYKRKLLQIQPDLQRNIDFIENVTLREKRREEIIAELNDMKKKIPASLKVVNSYEYAKNNINQDIEAAIRVYLEKNKISLDSTQLRDLVESNKQLQKYISASVKVKQIEIEYDTLKKITLVTKKISITDRSSTTLLEFIPNITNSEIVFLTPSEEIRSDVYEADVDNLKDGKLIYYIEEFIEPKEIENTETIYFKDTIPERRLGITGFFSFADSSMVGIPYYIIIPFIVLILIFLVSESTRQIRITRWKRDDNVKKFFRLLKNARNFIKNRDIDLARDNYNQMRGLYPLLPPGCKRYLYKKVRKIASLIDKKDILRLSKEYLACRKEGRAEDAQRLYEKMKEVYKRLPEKNKEKIYNKIFGQDYAL